MSELTAQEVAVAARRGAVTIAADPEMKHYNPGTVGLVYERTVALVAGAGSLATAAERIADDPALAHVPVDVLEPIVAASFTHFARGFKAEAEA